MDTKNLSLSFYEETKWEDCPPFLSDDLIVVCDGCGGAGGVEEKVDKNLIDSFEKIKDIILPDSLDEEINSTIKDYFEPIFNNPDVTRTSAFWASRVAMSRYIYYMKHSESINLDECNDFVKKGMLNVREKLNLKESEVSGLRVLPTTMVSILVKNEDENNIDIEVIWAGDSRAYILNKDGLKPISIDDETKDGGVTNYFSGRSDFETKINHREYKLAKPCMIFVCSDGLFDCLELGSLDFEVILLESLEQASSMEEYKNTLAEFYKARKTDDCTMSLLAIGFKDYESLKSYFIERKSYVDDLFTKIKENKSEIELRQNPNVFLDAYGKVFNRTKDKIRSICDEISINKDDPVTKELINKEVENKFKEQIENKNKEIQENLVKLKNNYSRSIKKYLLDNALNIDVYDVFSVEAKEKFPELFNKYDSLLKDREQLKEELLKEKETEKKYDELSTVLKNCLNKIFDALSDFGRFKLSSFSFDSSKAKIKLFGEIDNGEIDLSKIYKVLDIVEPLSGNDNFKYEFIDTYKELNRIRKDIPTLEEVENYKKQDLENVVSEIYDSFNGSLDCINQFTNDTYIKDLLAKFNLESQKLKEVDLSFHKLLADYLSNDENLKTFVYNRLKIGEKETCIDKFYNPILQKTINYYKSLNFNAEEIDEIIKKYEEYKNEAESLINDTTNNEGNI